MRRWAALFFTLLSFAGCGGGSGGSNTPGSSGGQPRNVVNVSVGGSGVCGGAANLPCADVTVCQPGTSNCQTIPDILIDTGSSGLRIFGSLIHVPLTQTTDNQSRAIGECIAFADLTIDWGAVKLADVVFGNEPAVTVPIQVIDSTFGEGAPAGCAPPGGTVVTTPEQALSNGILGVGFFQLDEGPYFSCSTTTCAPLAGAGIPSAPVQNPVFLLPVDNNGIVLMFPSVPDAGAPEVTGSLTLGIGTAGNNGVGPGVSVYPAGTATGTMTTLYPSNGTKNYESFIDSGTNGIVVPDPTIPSCPSGPFRGFLCPPSTLVLSASNRRIDGTYQPVSFQIADASKLLQSNNNVFNNLGQASSDGFFWGFPFFLGRTVYVGYDQATTPVGPGPFWAY